MDREQDREITIPLPNGCTLRCGEGDTYEWGGYVRIVSPIGDELLYWDANEWEEESESVMGAIFGAAITPLGSIMGKRGDRRTELQPTDWELVETIGVRRYWRKITEQHTCIYNCTNNDKPPGPNDGGYVRLDYIKQLKRDLYQ